MLLKNLDNALNLLSYFKSEKKTWGVRELAKEMDISHTIVYRILSTYEKHGILLKNPDTSKYQLGLRLLEYMLIIQDSFSISEIINPIMKKISEDTKETIFLTWLEGTEGVCIELAESSQRVKLTATIGSRTPLYGGAWGKAIMAFLPEEMTHAILNEGIDRITNKTITSPEKLVKNLEEIRQNGWCYSVGEYADNTAGIAVPLFNGRGQVVGSLTAAGPDYRIGPDRIEFILEHIRKGRDEIQKCLRSLNITYTVPTYKS